MGITPREQWGKPGVMPPDGLVVNGNEELQEIIESCRRSNTEIPPIGLVGGDLWRTLGGKSHHDRLMKGDAQLLSVDLGTALIDGHIYWFASHLIVRTRIWTGRTWIVANASHYGNWNIAPRAHPGDGLLDILDLNLTFSDRLKARSRVQAGNHVPHPDIHYQRRPKAQIEMKKETDVWIDGIKITKASQISVRVEPDALRVML